MKLTGQQTKHDLPFMTSLLELRLTTV